MLQKSMTGMWLKIKKFGMLLIVSSLVSACATQLSEPLITEPSVAMPAEPMTYILRAKQNIEVWQKKRAELQQPLGR